MASTSITKSLEKNNQINHSKQLGHVIVYAFPFGSHPAAILHPVKRLAMAAPDIQFSFISTKTSIDNLFKKPNYISNILPYSIPEEEFLSSVGDHHLKPLEVKTLEDFLKAAPGMLRSRMAVAEAEVGVACSCVISDAFLWFCHEIAEEKGVPWVAFWGGSDDSLSAHYHTDILRNKIGVPPGANGKDEIMANYVPGFSFVRITDLPSGIVTGDLNNVFSEMAYKMGLAVSKATAVLVNSFEELSPTVTKDLKSKIRVLNVPPFALTNSDPQTDSGDNYGCLEWLDNQEPNSVAYISFGTITMPPMQELISIAEALEESAIPFILVASKEVEMNLPQSFLEHISNDKKLGLVVPWAPQVKVLAHPSIGVLVTHCGWNSVLESIANGVPLIGRPMLGDHMLNQRFIECEFRTGIRIEDGVFTKRGTMKALHQVLSSEEGVQLRNRGKVLKELAEKSIAHGGTSYENFNAIVELLSSPKIP